MNWLWGLAAAIGLAVAATFFILPRHAQSQDKFEQRFPNLPKDSLARRARSNVRMEAEGVPVNRWLPVIESESDVKARSPEEVTMRAIALVTVALKGEGLERKFVDELIAKFALSQFLTPEEKAFIGQASPDARQRAKFTWRYEAAYVLFWSQGYFNALGPPRDICDPKLLAALLKDNDREALIVRAKPRAVSEILDQADLIYRYRWAIVDAEVKNAAIPANLNTDVAMERHQALNWLIQSDGAPWDDVSLDT